MKDRQGKCVYYCGFYFVRSGWWETGDGMIMSRRLGRNGRWVIINASNYQPLAKRKHKTLWQSIAAYKESNHVDHSH